MLHTRKNTRSHGTKASPLTTVCLSVGMSFAVVSDAGTPGISDPGMQLAEMCHKAGVSLTEESPTRLYVCGPLAIEPCMNTKCACVHACVHDRCQCGQSPGRALQLQESVFRAWVLENSSLKASYL